MDRERGSLCRSDGHPRLRRALRGAVAAAAATTAVMLLLPAVPVAGASTPAAAPATATTGSAPLTVLSQSSWVSPGQPFDLQLKATGPTPVTQLGVSVAVYPCLSSVSAFDQSLASAGPTGNPVTSTPSPLPVAGLPPVAGGGFDLSMPVTTEDSGSDTTATGFTIDLASATGQCGAYPSGVYPVRVELVDTADHQDVAGITTDLVYTDGAADTQRLRFALVLPLAIPPVPSAAPTSAQLLARPGAALQQPSAASLAGWSAMVSALTHSSVPVTIEASPQTIAALDASGHQSLVSPLTTLATDSTVHQFVAAPFTPVNAAGLVDAGLGAELVAQIARGAQALAPVTHVTTQPNLGAWVSNDPLDTATLTQLASAGYSQVVLPADSVVSPPTDGSTAEPFDLATAHGSSVEALAANADLASRFSDLPDNPVLAANQLVAELSQIYYEKPNDSTPRGLVVEAPSDWGTDPAFVTALSTALSGNPIVQAVTTNGLFDTFATTSSCRSGACRLLPTTVRTGLPVAAIRQERRRIYSFGQAAPSARSLTTAMGDLVLVGESELLHPSEQSRVLHNAGSALDAQLDQITVGDQPITLTSLRASVPIISIESSAPYPVTAVVTLTSDQLLFGPHMTSQWTELIPLRGHTTVSYVTVQTRGTGVSKVELTLRSPAGALVMSTGEVEVRSTATSVVGIVLSLGAVVVLAVWWIRTSRKRRALRRADEEAEAATPVGPQ